jgi:CheY-like chemotaxis protein
MRGAATTAAAGAPAAPADGLAGRLRVLVIDDEPLVGQMIERLLAGHDTTAVTSGEAALSLLAADDGFDVILCDFMMPGLSGTRLAGVITERHGRLRSRIVFMSSTADAQRLLYRSELRWVAKPARYEQLARCISDVVASASPAEDAPIPELAAAGT